MFSNDAFDHFSGQTDDRSADIFPEVVIFWAVLTDSNHCSLRELSIKICTTSATGTVNAEVEKRTYLVVVPDAIYDWI